MMNFISVFIAVPRDGGLLLSDLLQLKRGAREATTGTLGVERRSDRLAMDEGCAVEEEKHRPTAPCVPMWFDPSDCVAGANVAIDPSHDVGTRLGVCRA